MEIKGKEKCKNHRSTITTAPEKWSNLNKIYFLNVGFKVKRKKKDLWLGKFISALCYQRMVEIYHVCKNSPLNYTKLLFLVKVIPET